MKASDLIRKYKWDLILIAIFSAIAIALAILAHGQVKWYTGQVAMVSPLIFAALILLGLTLVGVAGSARWFPRVLRVLLTSAAVVLVAPTLFLELEKLVAPIEWGRGTTPAAVVDLIKTDCDSDRIRAWARILTLPKEQKDDVAAALAPVLLGTDAKAQHSAALTLQVSLRKHTLAAMAAMRSDLREYLATVAQHGELSERERRAGSFARDFIGSNLTAVRKALSKNKRKYLPEGGLEALFLALAADPGTGRLYLEELARHGDQTEKPLAETVMRLAAIPLPTAASH
ncbi:MAG: hypothetical protein FJ146_02125 [Deltaproteobacteria bacterium]|nr:hypothetical protein [Deltaproteobacteria bacterium]